MGGGNCFERDDTYGNGSSRLTESEQSGSQLGLGGTDELRVARKLADTGSVEVKESIVQVK